MKCKDRYEQYKDENFDTVIMKIKNGTIKSGRYSRLVKIKKDYKFGKELFNDGSKRDSERE